MTSTALWVEFAATTVVSSTRHVNIRSRVERNKKLLNLDIAVVSNDVTGPNKHANVI